MLVHRSLSLPHRLARACALFVVLASACGSARGVEVVRVQRSGVPVKPTPTPIPVYDHPITGVAYDGPQDWQERPPLAIKVENSSVARPQAGLEKADLVYEELAEGGITRFVAVFQSRDAGSVGPVRSARMVDPDILAPIGGLFAYAGGVPPVVAAIRAADSITDVSINRVESAYRRDRGRKAPHNLYTTTAGLWKGRDGVPPQPLFTFVADDTEKVSGGDHGPGIAFAFAANSDRIRYVYSEDMGAYLRFHDDTPHSVEAGLQLSSENVVIQFVSVTASGIVDTAGQRSPDSNVLGEGEAILLRGGRAFRGTWVRGSAGEPTRFLDAAGEPMRFAQGQTWIELVPRGRPATIG